MEGDHPGSGGEVSGRGLSVLSILAAAALIVAGLAQLVTLANRFVPLGLPSWSGPFDVEFQPITGVLAVVVAVGTLLRSSTARTILTGLGIGGFLAVALWPPWAMLDTEHPVPAWIGLFIIVFMGASLATGWRERRISTGHNLLWQVVAGGGIGWALVYGVLVLTLVWVVLTSPMTI
jgi:hypothetical protein